VTTDAPELDHGERRAIEAAMRAGSGRAVAVLVDQLGDFDLAEEAVQDAWLDAIRSWPRDGTPDNPIGWVVTTARRRAIDRLRQRRRTDRLADRIGGELLTRPAIDESTREWADDLEIPDERLALLFTCCHPALAAEARVALTLRAVCGLTTREIARLFGVTEATMQQRIVRTKQRITAAGISYRVPERAEFPERLSSVHYVIYAMFTEGYAAAEHRDFIRVDMTDEAIRLAGFLTDLLPEHAESLGLHALLLLHDARRAGRRDPDGSLVLLADQVRTTWDREQITAGIDALDRAIERGTPGPYQLQAAIAALHAQAPSVEETDWTQIAALSGELIAMWSSPAALLAHAVAVGMADGADAGLVALAEIADGLQHDHRWHAAVGHMHELAGRHDHAADAFVRAADMARHPLEAERLRARVRRP
jgi:RNA polymerase sigma factor (sigma-70 family)